jgi:hypothetical protein
LGVRGRSVSSGLAVAQTVLVAILRYFDVVERLRWPSNNWMVRRSVPASLDRFQEWRDNLPSGLANSATAEALDAVLELRGYVEELQAVELPKGFGRD